MREEGWVEARMRAAVLRMAVGMYSRAEGMSVSEPHGKA